LAAFLLLAAGLTALAMVLLVPAQSLQPNQASQTRSPAQALAAESLDPSPANAQLPTPGGLATPVAQLALQRDWDRQAWDSAVDPVLVARLDQALSGVDGHIGLAVKELGTDRGAVLDGDLELPSASLYKLPVLYTVFSSGIGLDEPLPITQQALAYDTGTMELGAGETLTVAEALERMITLSDNTSAVMLGSRVGAARINTSLAALGMDTTHYSLERMTTSALDMLHLVELIGEGKAVSPAASADMLHLMLRQRVNDRLPRLLPATASVAHKTGNLPGTVNDVGIIYGSTSTVAIAALISDTDDEAAAATGIARVALATYTYFEDQPEAADRPLIPPAPSRPIPAVRREPRPPTPTPAPTIVAAASPTPTSEENTNAAVPNTPLPAPTPVPTAAVRPTPIARALAPTATLAKPTAIAAVATATPVPARATATPMPQPTRTVARPTATAAPQGGRR
jgi:beta-lactamase class A